MNITNKIAYFDHTAGKHTIDGLAEVWNVRRHNAFDRVLLKGKEYVFVEHLELNAVMASRLKSKEKLILRLNAMELYQGKLHKISWKNVDLLIVHSHHLKDYFLERWGFLKKNQIKVVPLGIDTESFNMENNSKNNRIAVVSEIHWRKGVQDIPNVLRALPNHRIHHIGKVINQDALNYLNWRVVDAKVADRYYYNGTVGKDKVNDWLKDKYYYLHLSYTEGMPRSAIEAMSKGKVCFIRRFRGADRIFPEFMLWDTVEDLKGMFNNKHNPEKFRDYAVEHFDINKVAKQMMEAIQ